MEGENAPRIGMSKEAHVDAAGPASEAPEL
jgi:hypothetical protein